MSHDRGPQPIPPEPVPPLVGEATLAERDFVNIWTAVPQFKKQRAIFLFMIVAAVGAGATSGGGGSTLSGWLRWFAVGFPIVLTAVFAAGMLWAMPRLWARRACKDAGEGVMRFRLDHVGLTVESALRNHQLAWGALPRWLETEDAFVIYTGSASLLVVPKRAFAVGQVEAVRALLGQRVAVVPQKNQMLRLFVIWAALVLAFLSIWQFLSMGTPR